MKNQKKSFLTYFVIMCALVLSTVSAAQAATFTVSTAFDQNDNAPGDGVCNAGIGVCTLRAAIQEANALPGADVIKFSSDFDAPNAPQKITLIFGGLEIKDSVQILGPGARQLAVDGNETSRVITVRNTAPNVFITGLTIQNGYTYTRDILTNAAGISNFSQGLVVAYVTIRDNVATGDDPAYGEYGGGITNYGNMSLAASLVVDNQGGYGGGIVNKGNMVISNTTIHGNSSQHNGGGIDQTDNGTLTIINSTITGNQAPKPGGGIRVHGNGTVSLRNTIVADNVSQFNNDVHGKIVSHGNNIVKNRGTSTGYTASDLPDGIDPKLDFLKNNGGPTDTRKLRENSPAINTGNGCVTVQNGCLGALGFINWDQRGVGFSRFIGSSVDIGAYESAFRGAALVEIGGSVLKQNGHGLNKAVVTLTDADGATRTTETNSNGRFSFDDVATGESYTITVEHRRFEFAPQSLRVTEARDDITFVPVRTRSTEEQ